ncbi:MAG: YeeE/YedE family protein [Chelatococcus sp.]|uniref:YeeE/YedE family protein n=1 Tax=Chelatococcus sp. TaxID=1953771 RepID=UPI0025BC0D0C|nr:YeeE/YedE thiosulfate transporter family protein [Chelatococcus sp.]MBX3540524.1 YeeE/YedE family protein [Chelatococcus sp.]
MATQFTPVASFFGGVLIGLSAVLLMLFAGRIAGISGIAARLLPPYGDDQFAGRLAFVVGLVLAPAVYGFLAGGLPTPTLAAGPFVLIVAGLLVGFGAVWGRGCTSGHGVCGLARLSPRSLVATTVFMATAIVTVFLVRHVL